MFEFRREPVEELGSEEYDYYRTTTTTTTTYSPPPQTTEENVEGGNYLVIIQNFPNIFLQNNIKKVQVYLGHRREDNGCPEGQVLDIYGYCRLFPIQTIFVGNCTSNLFREDFHEESRDWDWWRNIRNFVLGGHDSGYHYSYY